MGTMNGLLPETVEARTIRVRSRAWTDSDLAWLRARVEIGSLGWAVGDGAPARRLLCDCRCRCHVGACGLPIDTDVMDCGRACRSSHILASECSMDETRGADAVRHEGVTMSANLPNVGGSADPELTRLRARCAARDGSCNHRSISDCVRVASECSMDETRGSAHV